MNGLEVRGIVPEKDSRVVLRSMTHPASSRLRVYTIICFDPTSGTAFLIKEEIQRTDDQFTNQNFLISDISLQSLPRELLLVILDQLDFLDNTVSASPPVSTLIPPPIYVDLLASKGKRNVLRGLLLLWGTSNTIMASLQRLQTSASAETIFFYLY